MLRSTMILMLIASISTLAFTQDMPYEQYVIVNLEPKPDKIAAFEAGLAAHNKKYHTADPFKAWVFAITVGKGSGSYWYNMGPCTLAQLDARTTTPEHDADWNNNVLAYCTGNGESGYWRVDPKIHYDADGSQNFTKTRLRIFTLKPGQRARAEDLLTKFTSVLAAKKLPVSYHVYWRFESSEGPHVVAAMSFANWAFLDTYDGISDAYEEMYGKGSFDLFVEDLNNAVDVSKTFDQHIEFMPNLSSNQ